MIRNTAAALTLVTRGPSGAARDDDTTMQDLQGGAGTPGVGADCADPDTTPGTESRGPRHDR